MLYGQCFLLFSRVKGTAIEPQETPAYSFILKVWIEEPNRQGGHVRWRGLITHVPSGVRRYVTHLDQVSDFIEPYLTEMGIVPGPSRRLRTWFDRMRQKRSSGNEI